MVVAGSRHGTSMSSPRSERESCATAAATDACEDEANRKRVFDLLARDAGRQHRPHLVSIHRVLARELPQHAHRCAEPLVDGRGLEIRKDCRDLRLVVIGQGRDTGMRLRADSHSFVCDTPSARGHRSTMRRARALPSV